MLQATAEQQAHQQVQLGAFGKEIEKQNDGIRSLIVVARIQNSNKAERKLQLAAVFPFADSRIRFKALNTV